MAKYQSSYSKRMWNEEAQKTYSHLARGCRERLVIVVEFNMSLSRSEESREMNECMVYPV